MRRACSPCRTLGGQHAVVGPFAALCPPGNRCCVCMRHTRSDACVNNNNLDNGDYVPDPPRRDAGVSAAYCVFVRVLCTVTVWAEPGGSMFAVDHGRTRRSGCFLGCARRLRYEAIMHGTRSVSRAWPAMAWLAVDRVAMVQPTIRRVQYTAALHLRREIDDPVLRRPSSHPSHVSLAGRRRPADAVESVCGEMHDTLTCRSREISADGAECAG